MFTDKELREHAEEEHHFDRMAALYHIEEVNNLLREGVERIIKLTKDLGNHDTWSVEDELQAIRELF